MSIRDFFAGQALSGLLAARDQHGRSAFTNATDDENAKSAYALADSMLKAREQ
jgi:hypothetical protein